jgi:hypothetical protein
MLYHTNHHGPMALALRLRGGAPGASRKRPATEQRPSRGTGPAQPRHRSAAPEAPVHMPVIQDDDDDDEEEEAYHPSEPDSPSDDAPSPSASDGSNDNISSDGSGDEDAGEDATPEAARRAANGEGLTTAQLQVEMIRQIRKSNTLLVQLQQTVAAVPAPAPAAAPAPVQPLRHERTGSGQNKVPPIEELGQQGGKYETSFADVRAAVLTRLTKCGRLALEPVRVPAQPRALAAPATRQGRLRCVRRQHQEVLPA